MCVCVCVCACVCVCVCARVHVCAETVLLYVRHVLKSIAFDNVIVSKLNTTYNDSLCWIEANTKILNIHII